jgi:hypothetical protein
MDKIQILYTSWCNKKGSDKVWGYFSLNYEPRGSWDYPVFVFYGARGKSLTLKQHILNDDLINLRRSKERKGYEFIEEESDFLKLCSNFYEEVDNKLTFAILSGNKYKAAGSEF